VKEQLGYLCRWGLLMLAGAVLVLVGCLYCSAVAVSSSELSAAIILPDFVRMPAGHLWLPCYTTPASPVTRVILWHTNITGLEVSQGDTEPLHLWCECPHGTGEYRVTARGNPYSSLAMASAQSRLRVLGPKGRIFVVDCRLVDEALGDPNRTAVCKAAVAEMKLRGQIVYFTDRPVGEMAALRDRLRGAGFEDPVLCPPEGAQSPEDLLKQLECDHWRPAGELTIVTGDVQLALAAALQRWSAVVVTAAPVSPSLRLPTVRDVAFLKDWLARQPIPNAGHRP
jgi:hypothetical protein